ncbi:hypothetical protein MAPG_05266 [Magnaporthiopsis poae ATCC 64411]|uniref:Uncharacterized protein n=1 Tax=Magnaporthiopsis poae (strain ATCC 64411 / 73-15) TaxID=644358 RepID=A0A0C4DYY1_MAGP6|nr:hypothetical protein MAPG_05266 [Magnaporthiopsis poae ATCC 64411]
MSRLHATSTALGKERRCSVDDDGDCLNTVAAARKIKKPRKTGCRSVPEESPDRPHHHCRGPGKLSQPQQQRQPSCTRSKRRCPPPPEFETLSWGIKHGVVVNLGRMCACACIRGSEQTVLDCFSVALLPKRDE